VKIANRYEPTGNANWGGMAEVHECIDTHLSRRVMLKRVKRSADVRRLIDEQKALLKVRSKHVVQLLDIVTYDYAGEPEFGLILEHIEGHDLAEGSFNYGSDYLKTVWQIASGLAEIHSAGIIHRDIKPDNVRVDQSGVVKIIDFGLAREAQVDSKTKSIIGTPGYMAPELHGTSTIAFTGAVDVYALGWTAISLLTPLTGISPDDNSHGLDAALGSADANIKDVLLSCIRADQAKRPTAVQIRDALTNRLLSGRHRARLIDGGNVVQLDITQPSATIRTTAGQLQISYTGEEFVCTGVTGSVFANNHPIKDGHVLSCSCVIIIGSYGGAGRAFLPFDLSRPEPMI
jgi:eukaryotic-like serine/threonine-protein kinase